MNPMIAGTIPGNKQQFVSLHSVTTGDNVQSKRSLRPRRTATVTSYKALAKSAHDNNPLKNRKVYMIAHCKFDGPHVYHSPPVQ